MSEQITAENHNSHPEQLDAQVAADLDDFSARIERAAEEYAANPGQYSATHMPDSFSGYGDTEAVHRLRSGQYDPVLISRYVGIVRTATELGDTIAGRQPSPPSLLYSIKTTFAPEHIQAAFADEDTGGEIHTLLSDTIDHQKADPYGALTEPILFAQQLYGLDRPTELLRLTDDAYRTDLREKLLDKEGIKWLRFLEQSPPDPNEPYSSENEKEKKRNWMREVVLTATDISDPEIADSYIYAASRNVYDGELAVADIVQKIDALGQEKLQTLAEFSGNFALADYSTDQLERMVKLAESDPGEIARLQDHDVQVVFVNRMGDHNNILATVPEMTDDERRRCVYFEIQSFQDMYRSMKRLHDRGIEPSSLFFAHHANAGQSIVVPKPGVGSQRLFMEIASIHAPAFIAHANDTYSEKQNFFGYSMHDMRGLVRMIDEYMQPSRGIDDSPEAVGQKQIILDACYAAAEGPVKDISASTGEPIEVGDASVISKLADTMVKYGNKSSVVLYGAPDGIQARPTPRGFNFTVLNQTVMDRELLGALKLTVHAGRIHTDRVNEIALRNFDKPAKEAA